MHSEFPNYYYVLSKSFKKTLLNRLTAADLPVTGTLIDDANNWFLSRSTEFAQRALIDAFHAWRETTGYPDNSESSVAYDEFNQLLLDPTQRTALVNDRFPKLSQLQERAFSYSIDAIVEAVERFYEDRPHLAMLNVMAAQPSSSPPTQPWSCISPAAAWGKSPSTWCAVTWVPLHFPW